MATNDSLAMFFREKKEDPRVEIPAPLLTSHVTLWRLVCFFEPQGLQCKLWFNVIHLKGLLKGLNEVTNLAHFAVFYLLPWFWTLKNDSINPQRMPHVTKVAGLSFTRSSLRMAEGRKGKAFR